MQRRYLKITALLATLGLVAAACAAPSPAGGGATGTPAGGGTSKGEIVIVTEFPTSGASRSSGRPAEAGASYAIQQTAALKGFKITVKNNDHAVNGVHDPQKAVQNLQAAIADSKVLGVVGPFNSNVARAMIPVANRASLALISPSNTNECLTEDFPYCDPKPGALRPAGGNNYFRVAGKDTVQGPGMADFAVDTLKVTKVAAWSDNETFGKGVADNFCKQLVKKGGSCVVRQDFDTKTTNDFKPFIQRAKEAGAQAFYAGAVTATKGCIPRAQMKGIFETSTPYLGPDGLGDTQCIKDAGDMAANMYFTNMAADAAQDTANTETINAFKKAFSNAEDYGAYTFPGYDSAKILLDAIGRAIDTAGGNLPTRAQVVTAMGQTTNLKLTTGTYSFTASGDPKAFTMSFYQTAGADWKFVKQFPVNQ